MEDTGLKPAQLLRWMDRYGIEKAIVMAVEVPEEVDFLVSTEALLGLTRRHRDRLFPCVPPILATAIPVSSSPIRSWRTTWTGAAWATGKISAGCQWTIRCSRRSTKPVIG